MEISIDVISLPHEGDRRRDMTAQVEQIGLPWRFVDAHTSPAPDLCLNRGAWRRMNGRLLSKSEIACYSSHYSILREIAEGPNDHARIVFEDDAILDVGFFKDHNTLQSLAQNFSYLRFNGHLFAAADEICIIGRRRVLRFRDRVHSTLGYMIDPKAARRLVERLGKVDYPIDVAMDRFWSHGVYCYCVYHFVAIERTSLSSIGRRDLEVSTVDWLYWKSNNQVEKVRRTWANLVYRMLGDTEFCRIGPQPIWARDAPVLEIAQ